MTKRSSSRARSFADARPVIVVALSGRQLAAAARAAGWQPWVVDAFADDDTRRLASRWMRIATDASYAFARGSLEHAIRRLRVAAPDASVVWGSGLEAHGDWLTALAASGCVLGSAPRALAIATDPLALARHLRRLDIPHPAVVIGQVPRRGRWVTKARAASGGAHVRFQQAGALIPPGRYAQRFVSGAALSVVALASATDVSVVGYGTQLFASVPGQPFRHAGAVALPDVAPALQASIHQALCRLREPLGLRGLFGVDLVVTGPGQWQLIELNPRPPGSFDLHLAPSVAFRAHVAACRGQALPVLRRRSGCRAQAVCRASAALGIPNSLDWPAWITDRPVGGSRVPAGAPVCTVQASGATPAIARRRLAGRLNRLRGWLGDADRRLPLTSLEILAGEHTHE